MVKSLSDKNKLGLIKKDYKKEFLKCLESINPYANTYNVFQDFLTLASLSIKNALVKSQEIEKEYMEVVSKYKDPNKFSQLFGILALALEEKMQDFLGEIYMQTSLGNKHTGQFFTPYHISHFMAECAIGDKNLEKEIKEKGYIKISEPCCGAGGMIIAASEVLLKRDINPQQYMRFTGVDIDIKCCQMTYIQTTLLGLRGSVIHGNSLTLESWDIFTTPMTYFPLVA